MSGPEDDGASGGDAIDLPEDFRREIRALAKALPTLDYYEVLGIPRQAEAATVRDAFGTCSKRFHPDRFFNKEVGSYRPLINEIYKVVVAAHETLRDAEARAAYDERLPPFDPTAPPKPTAAPPPEELAAGVEQGDAKGARRGRGAGSGRSSLRKRMGLRSPGMLLAGLENELRKGRGRAERLLAEAEEQKQRGNFPQAAELLRTAVSFAPRDPRFQAALDEVLPLANAEHVKSLVERASILVEKGDLEGALALWTEAAELSPDDAPLHNRLAVALLRSGAPPAQALPYAQRAVDLDGDSVPYLKTLAAAHAGAGDAEKARKYLQRVWEIDPLDKDVKRQLQRL